MNGGCFPHRSGNVSLSRVAAGSASADGSRLPCGKFALLALKSNRCHRGVLGPTAFKGAGANLDFVDVAGARVVVTESI